MNNEAVGDGCGTSAPPTRLVPAGTRRFLEPQAPFHKPSSSFMSSFKDLNDEGLRTPTPRKDKKKRKMMEDEESEQ